MASTTQTGACRVCGTEQYHTSPDTCGTCGADYTPPQVPDLIVTRHRGAVEWLVSGGVSRMGVLPPADGGTDWHGRWSAWPTRDTADPKPYDRVRYLVPVAGPESWRTVADVPVKAEVSADDVRGRHVVGNLPLHLAAMCASITAIEFDGPPPRGAEYTADDMDRAGARLRAYRVVAA